MKQLLSLLILVCTMYANSSFDFNKWFTYYYTNPQPEKFEQALHVLSENKILERKKSLAPMSAFFSELFASNEIRLHDWVQELKKLNEKERQVFILALYYSNVENKFLYIKDIIASHKELLLTKKLKRLKSSRIIDINPNSAGRLDMYWGAFMASGNEKYVERITSALKLLEKKGVDVVVGQAAKWSLTSNAYQHEKVLNICKEMISKPYGTSPFVNKTLIEIVSKVEKQKSKNI